ncbi:dihydropyrimidinase [Telmatospirillum siberiense]|uniref:D-hydantoinase/dihydropyrimidinase n=1 Tax=Telmatospirillum siberiense TaxID=382514 RepID=A0A2N3Q1W4_9PROT|nr:dihydropyrimidinase [Telmatospirillum siberiense]PKU26639.1 dihydropyrimidinase [Telmatospirillum siberiense]
MTTDILIRGGTVISESGRQRADLLCHEGRIAAVERDLEAPAGASVIDAGGCFVMPGGIDPHTHMQLPMMGTVVADDFFTGTAAGAAGGTTTILDFVGPDKGQSPLDALAAWREKAAKASIDYGFHMTVSWWGEGFAAEMPALVHDHGVTSFKFFLAYKGGLMLPDEEILAGFLRCRDLGALPQVHAENGELIAHLQRKLRAEGVRAPAGHPLSRPSQCEGEATLRAITMAELLKMPLYVVHVSAAEAAEAIQKAQARGVGVIGETLPGFLAIDASVYENPDFDIAAGHVMSPPYRPDGHPQALWKAVEAGTLSITGTDHCCFTRAQKRLGEDDFTKIPNGCGGVEDRMNILWALGVEGGHISPERFVALTSANAAKTFNLWPRKGTLSIGADADIAILDPAKSKTISASTQHQNTDFSVWEGRRLKGSVVHTVAGGRHLWADGDLRAEAGGGRYLPRAPFGSVYENLRE